MFYTHVNIPLLYAVSMKRFHQAVSGENGSTSSLKPVQQQAFSSEYLSNPSQKRRSNPTLPSQQPCRRRDPHSLRKPSRLRGGSVQTPRPVYQLHLQQ